MLFASIRTAVRGARSRMFAGYGERIQQRPTAHRRGMAKNRRVEII